MAYNYIVAQLQNDLARIQEWLADEKERLAKTKDEHLKGLLKVRIQMYERNIIEITKTLQSYESQEKDHETV